MAHPVTMAYAAHSPDTTPWRQIGHALPAKQSIDVWAEKAGMKWKIEESPVQFLSEHADGRNSVQTFSDQKVLYRSDTKAPLSVVSNRYQVVQPTEVLEFYRDLTAISGFELETAGVLKAGRKFWALARTGKETVLKGNDVVKQFILLATSCDGTLATTATPTSIRVVCSNTLAMALNGATNAIKVPHSTSFDAKAVKRQLGIAVSGWDSFAYQMRVLSERKVRSHEAFQYFLKVICQAYANADPEQSLGNERALKRVMELYEGQGMGAELSAASGTAWGLTNAVTQWVDHEKRARSSDYRLDSAWFGQGANLKQRALHTALQLVA